MRSSSRPAPVEVLVPLAGVVALPGSSVGTAEIGEISETEPVDDETPPAPPVLVAYVHGDVARHFDYNYSCLNPDGAFCWCETQVYDDGSSYELRVLAVRTDGSQHAVLTVPLEGIPDRRNTSSPGDILDADAQGNQIAIAVRCCGSRPVIMTQSRWMSA